MRRNINGKIAFFSIMVLLVALSVPSASAAVDMYFNPDPAQIPGGYCNNTTVDLMMNSHTDTVDSWSTLIKFDPTCVNITGYQYQGPMSGNTFWQHQGDRIMVWNFKAGCQLYNGPVVTLTVHCENSSYCTSPLEFVDNGIPANKYVACFVTGRNVTWTNGTVLQGQPPAQEPDLTVNDIEVNSHCCAGYAFANECNFIKAEIAEINNTAVAGNFTVRFNVTDPYGVEATVCEELVQGIGASQTRDVWCNCSWVPTAKDLYNINVTVDSKDDITEINEGNNSLNISQMVYYNGYKGKRYTGGDDIETWQFHNGTVNLTYSTGDSKYQGGYNDKWTTYIANWTANNLTIPAGAGIKKASLNVYYTFDRTPASNVTDYWTLDFNSCPDVPIEQHYTDRKGYGSYNYPYGMVRYNVTNCFNVSGNQVVLDNAEPTDPHHVSLSGMVLLVVYEDGTYRNIWINEGFDIISARDSYCVNSTEATAYAPFAGGDIGNPVSAKLITVMQDAFDGDDKNRLYFGNGEWHGIWNAAAKQGATSIAINETDVLLNNTPWGMPYEARLQSHIPAGDTQGDGMGASKVILILEKRSEVNVKVPCGNIIEEGQTATVPIILEGIDDYGAGKLFGKNALERLDRIFIEHQAHPQGLISELKPLLNETNQLASIE